MTEGVYVADVLAVLFLCALPFTILTNAVGKEDYTQMLANIPNSKIWSKKLTFQLKLTVERTVRGEGEGAYQASQSLVRVSPAA